MKKKLKYFIVTLFVVFMTGASEIATAATQAQKEACTQELLEMLYSYDMTKHDISQYSLTQSEFSEVCDEVRYGVGAEIESAYDSAMSIYYTMSGGYMRTMRLEGANEDALDRYSQMGAVIDSILMGIESDMTDLDKLIYLHNTLVETVVYKSTMDTMYTASGALLDKQAVCAGYAKALNILLHRVGIDASYVKGTSLNHGWSYVELDGQWYHVDPTWDDTRTPVTGKVARTNLLRNDAEFGEDHGEWIVKRIEDSSDSTLYENWFVHDIVGEMCFEDGLWYYLDTTNNTVIAADVKSGIKETLFEYSSLGTVSLVDAVDDKLILWVNGQEISKTVEQWKVTTEKDAGENTDSGEGVAYPLDFSDISFWRSGQYIAKTGSFGSNRNRVCLNELIENTQEWYRVTISDRNYGIAVRELNARKRIVSSVELVDGDIYIPSDGTVYLAVTIYNRIQEKGITFETYEKLFADGFSIGFNIKGSTSDGTDIEIGGVTDSFVGATQPEENAPDLEEDTVPEYSEMDSFLALGDIGLWRSGQYIASTGSFGLNRNRMCLTELIENSKDSYTVAISDANYRMVIRELNARKRLISSADLGSGDTYVPTDGTVYLAITIYNCVREKGITWDTYVALFEEGFRVDVYAKNDGTEIPEDEEKESGGEIVEGSISGVLGGITVPENSQMSSQTPQISLRELFCNILKSGDISVHDVSAYGLTYFEFDKIWEEVIENEGYIAFEAWGGVFPSVTKNKEGIVVTTHMYDLAGGDVSGRYEIVSRCVEEVKAATIGMSELDKVLYVYEYVMSHTVGSTNGYITAYAGGLLGQGAAKCEGYARTCMLLLRELGIECYRVASTDMNHSWTYVKVNGEWYHLDATWDDGSCVKHVYLLRNAEEFDTIPGRHYNWKYVTDVVLPESTSKALEEWFVHDVVGQMFYENGMWYYTDPVSGSVVRSDIYGNQYEVLVENTEGGYVVTGVSDGVVSYQKK